MQSRQNFNWIFDGKKLLMSFSNTSSLMQMKTNFEFFLVAWLSSNQLLIENDESFFLIRKIENHLIKITFGTFKANHINRFSNYCHHKIHDIGSE